MKFEILDHTAELRLRIYGKTIEELFINAAEALAKIQKKNVTSIFRSSNKCNRKLKDLKKEVIKIQSVDINSLLVDFLNEILARSQINKCVYWVLKINIRSSQDLRSCEDKKLEREPTLKAEIIGYPVESFDEDIKAVTYQDLNIQKIKEIWQTCLVLDI